MSRWTNSLDYQNRGEARYRSSKGICLLVCTDGSPVLLLISPCCENRQSGFSLYYFILRRRAHYAHDQVREMTLHQFVTSGIVKEVENGQTKLLAGHKVADLPYGSATSEMLETAKRHLDEHFVTIGLLERYDETLLLFRRRLGWRIPIYVKQNVTRKRPAREQTDPETIEAIRSANEFDAELYRYASERLERELVEAGASFQRELVIFRLLNRLYTPYGRTVNAVRARLERYR